MVTCLRVGELAGRPFELFTLCLNDNCDCVNFILRTLNFDCEVDKFWIAPFWITEIPIQL